MNKKFSTLLTAGLLVGSSLYFPVNATDVTPEAFKKAIKEGVLLVNTEDSEALTLKDNKIELTGNVDLSSEFPSILTISTKDLVLTSKDASKKAKISNCRIEVTAENVTISNLDMELKLTGHVEGKYQHVLTVVADKFTAKGNTFTGGLYEGNIANIVNGLILKPKTKDAAYTISGNTFEGFAGTATDKSAPGGAWYSSALQVYKAVAENSEGSVDAVIDAASLKKNNTFKGNDADVFVRNKLELTEGSFVEDAYVTYDAKLTSALQAVIKEVATKLEPGKTLNFDGSAEELITLTTGMDQKIAVNTKDGIVSTIVAPAAEKVADKYILATKPEAGEYYVLAFEDNTQTKYVKAADGSVDELTKDVAIDAAALWKMEQALDADGDYTFIFKNKKGETLTVDNNGFLQSAVKGVPYGVNGVPFALKVDDDKLAADDNGVVNFGLYKADVHNLTAAELNFFENDGFSVTINPKDLVGNPFTGKLTPMSWDKTNKKFVETNQKSTTVDSYYLKNENGDYIVAKLFGAEGGNKNHAYYVFATATEKDLIADLKADKDEKRKLFGEFKAYYKPVSAADNMEKIERIDSMEVKVLNKDNTIDDYAPLGYANISTTDKTEKTLTASLESAQYQISFTMGNNVVDPKTIVDGKFVTITKITEDGDLIYAATDCSGKGEWVESVGNKLEAQWAVTYDTNKNEYTLTNRENLEVVKAGIKKNSLREDANDKDDLYVFNGEAVKIELIDVNEDDGYMWLGDVQNQLFKMAHWSGVYNDRAWFTTDEKANITINVDESKAVNIAAKSTEKGINKVDTAKIVSKLGYFDGETYKTKDNTLKVPVYMFQTPGQDSNFGLADGKYAFGENQDTLAIREDNGHHNLRVVGVKDGKANLECAKVYASTSPNEGTAYLKKAQGLYTETQNDLFDVVKNDAPLYRRFDANDPAGQVDDAADTLRFVEKYQNEYLQIESNKNFMKEGIDFLGIAAKSYNEEGKSFIVDTAFVNRWNGEKKPQYLISIDREDEPGKGGKMCSICQAIVDAGGERPAGCIHDEYGKLPFHFGQYLVNFADSVKKASNKEDYAWKGYTRAGFVKAAHMGDSLYILTGRFADMTVATFDTAKIIAAVKDKKYSKDYIVNLTKDEHKPVTWSMRFVDPVAAGQEGAQEADRAFLLESLADENQPAIAPTKAQWLKNQNGCLVLSGTAGANSTFNQFTDDDDALIFNVEKGNKEDMATDNETIATSEVVVIAGEGNITIANAAGKKVVISNILGQVVANTVLASDNAVIAAPQGVVVVAVEGEEAVKAIVK